MLVVQDIADTTSDHTKFGAVLDNYRVFFFFFTIDNGRLLPISFSNFKINIIKKQVNFVAHTLTGSSKSYASHQMSNLIQSYIIPTLMNAIILIY
jgi:hypothetical protein